MRRAGTPGLSIGVVIGLPLGGWLARDAGGAGVARAGRRRVGAASGRRRAGAGSSDRRVLVTGFAIVLGVRVVPVLVLVLVFLPVFVLLVGLFAFGVFIVGSGRGGLLQR